MKTAEEILSDLNGIVPSECIDILYEKDDLIKAMEVFAEQFKPKWISIKEKKPLCYKTGNFDGMNSDFVLFITEQGLIFEGGLNEGVLDGYSFSDWYKNDGYLMTNVTHWMPSPIKI